MALIQQDMGLLESKQVVFTGIAFTFFASNTGYNRYSLFERNPWDPNTRQIFERYETFYDNGALTQDVFLKNKHFMDLFFDGTIPTSRFFI